MAGKLLGENFINPFLVIQAVNPPQKKRIRYPNYTLLIICAGKKNLPKLHRWKYRKRGTWKNRNLSLNTLRKQFGLWTCLQEKPLAVLVVFVEAILEDIQGHASLQKPKVARVVWTFMLLTKGGCLVIIALLDLDVVCWSKYCRLYCYAVENLVLLRIFVTPVWTMSISNAWCWIDGILVVGRQLSLPKPNEFLGKTQPRSSKARENLLIFKTWKFLHQNFLILRNLVRGTKLGSWLKAFCNFW